MPTAADARAHPVIADAPALEGIETAVYVIPTDAPEADGTLAGPPVLIEGSASAKGPALLQSLLSGLQRCQPYNMLPADKYQEWKSIDMRFTPADMGGG